MSYVVLKPFLSAGRMTRVNANFQSSDEQYLRDLERGGLIAKRRPKKAILSAPANKDAAQLRKNK